jgi:hypothetical protein
MRLVVALQVACCCCCCCVGAGPTDAEDDEEDTFDMLRRLVALQRMVGKNGTAGEGGGGVGEGTGGGEEEEGSLGHEVHVQAGCTAVVALVKGSHVYVANAGRHVCTGRSLRWWAGGWWGWTRWQRPWAVVPAARPALGAELCMAASPGQGLTCLTILRCTCQPGLALPIACAQRIVILLNNFSAHQQRLCLAMS